MSLIQELLFLNETSTGAKAVKTLLRNGYFYVEDESDENVVTLKNESGSTKSVKREDYEDATAEEYSSGRKKDWGSIGEPS